MNSSKTTAAKPAVATATATSGAARPKTGGNLTGILCALLIVLLAAGGYFYLQQRA